MQTATRTSPSPEPIRPRAFPGRFDASIPKHWFAGSVFATHLANGVNLLFPAGERFFVRSVRAYLDQVKDDPELVEAIRGFSGQEGRHAQAHERFFEILEGQGYAIRPYLKAYERIAYGLIEKVAPPKLRLATTAAAEHFTAVMAENFLVDSDELDLHPVMKELLQWHSAEEIEHRAVAFEVLQRVDPSYAWRIGGLAMATLTLMGFWIAATAMLLAQEDVELGKRLRAERSHLAERQPFGERVFGRGIRAYLRRDFHPAHATHLDELAKRYFERSELFGERAAVRG
jgi:predicted metal-dependent hydrolase